jgi:hypothetical protein
MYFTKLDKAKAYAIALPDDISAERFEVVEDGKLWRGWAGTVYGVCVMTTERGHKFATFEEARANAEFFVAQCKAIVEQSA